MRLLAYLRARYGRHDPALHLPPDPRPAGRNIVADGWACPATVYGSVCGRPKTPEKPTCGLAACKAWATRQKAEREAQRPRRARVLPIRGRR